MALSLTKRFAFWQVCNHPELFERREVKSPFVMSPGVGPYLVPKLVYHDQILSENFPGKNKKLHLLYNKLNVFNSSHVNETLKPKGT